MVKCVWRARLHVLYYMYGRVFFAFLFLPLTCGKHVEHEKKKGKKHSVLYNDKTTHDRSPSRSQADRI